MDTNTHTSQLPATIRAYLDAQEARDADAALAVLSPGAVISDVGETFTGEAGLRRFVTEAGAEFTVVTAITGVRRDGDSWVVGHHLEGDFPGETADLDYRFVLASGDTESIERIDIVVAS
jgi:hypothetical protein